MPTDQPLSRKLTERNRDEFWHLVARTEARCQQARSNDGSFYAELEARFAFMNRPYINQLGVSLHNHNRVPRRITPELTLASLLYCWYHEVQRLCELTHLSFREFYEGKVSIYSGKPFNVFDPASIEQKLHLREGDYCSCSLRRDYAIDFTQTGRAYGRVMDTRQKDGWLLEAQVSPQDFYYFSHTGYELEVIMRGEFSFERKTRIVAGEVAPQDDWGMYKRHQRALQTA